MCGIAPTFDLVLTFEGDRRRAALDRPRVLSLADTNAQHAARFAKRFHHVDVQPADLSLCLAQHCNLPNVPRTTSSHRNRFFRIDCRPCACTTAGAETSHAAQDRLGLWQGEAGGKGRDRKDWLARRGRSVGTADQVQDVQVRARSFVNFQSRGVDSLTPTGRRELAAREHIVAHELGKGQQAFAPNRRDMAAYRAEQEQRRKDLSKPPQPISAAPAPGAAAAAQPPVDPLAALRISQPLAGTRVVQPRASSIPKPQPVARPQPRQAQQASDASAETSAATTTPLEAADAPATASTTTAESAAPPPERDISLFPSTPSAAPSTPLTRQAASSEPPLLPSPACSSYFVEPLSWMSPILETGVLAGKITCPNKKCGAKLGNFDWAGTRASFPLPFSPCVCRELTRGLPSFAQNARVERGSARALPSTSRGSTRLQDRTLYAAMLAKRKTCRIEMHFQRRSGRSRGSLCLCVRSVDGRNECCWMR